MSDPTFKQLRYFAALAETGHYRKAAERVGISQPSLSLQIGNLEASLRLKLVERGRAGAVLTPAGREVLHQSRSILEAMRTLTETADRLSSGVSGTIRLGTSPTLGPYLLPKVVQHLHQTYPSLRLAIRDGAPLDLLAELLAGRHDVLLTQLPVASTDVSVERLFREPLNLATSLDHPLAGKEMVQDADLTGQNVLLLTDRFALHAQVAELVREVGANLMQDYEGTSLDALRQMTAMDMGMTFLPALYARSEIPTIGGDVALIGFRKGRFARSVGLVWRKAGGPHAAYTALAKAIRRVVREEYSALLTLEG